MNPEPSSPYVQSQKPVLCIDNNRCLGTGKFPVFLGIENSTQNQYAVKIFPQDKTSRQCFKRERALLKELNHPNIIKFVSSLDPLVIGLIKCSAIVIEYAPGGDFHNCIFDGMLQGEMMIRRYFQQLIDGVEYLHSKQIAHCDLKLENLLVGQDFLLKITDFDQSYKEGVSNTSLGSKNFRAPELLKNECKNYFAADIYSAGIILYAFVTREVPFREQSEGLGPSDYAVYCSKKSEYWLKKSREGVSSLLFDENFLELIDGMLEKNPDNRWTLEQIKSCRWYNNFTNPESSNQDKKLAKKPLSKCN